jgi:CHAT domain
MADAVASFDAAAGLFNALGQPAPAAQTQVPKIMALAMLGRNDEAAACAERAQAAFVAQGDMLAAAKVSLNLGSLHLRRDAFEPSVHHYREAVRLFARVGDREHSVMADIGLGDALTALGELDEAERIYARARVRAQAHGLPVLQAMVDESAALLDLSRGHFGPALAGFERSRARYEALAMPQHLAIAEKQLADAYLELRLLPEAERLHDQALQKFDALSMPGDKAWTLAQRGRGQALQGRPADADASFAAASALFAAQRNGAGQAGVALARAELALAQRDASAALRWADAAAAAYAEVAVDEGAARAAIAQAEALLLASRPGEARAAFEATLAQARQRRRLAAEVRSLVGRALAEQALGNEPAARSGFEAAVALAEELRLALPGDDIRSAFLADQLRPYRELLHAALQDHDQAPGPAAAAAVLKALDRVRARSLSERLAGGAGSEAPGDDATRALRARVSWLARRAQGLEDDEDAPSATLIGELHRSEQQLLERARRQRLVDTPGAGQVLAGEAIDVDALAAALGADDALVEYGLHGDELFACIVRPGGVRIRRHLAAWPQVVQAVQALRFQLDALGQGAAPLQHHLTMLAERCQVRLVRLHALVWAPLADALPAAGRVLLVAPPPLGSVPFPALHDGVQPLAARHQLAWAPSAAGAQRCWGVTTAGPPRRAFVLGESSHLPHAADEARAVAQGLTGATLRLDAQATIAALQSEAAREADLVHLACHAQFRTDSPSFSALHLHDGALTAEQIETLRLGAKVVVLSGCETAGATERAPSGDEWVGLVRAFLLAGAGRVVASLWPVDDRITGEFMAAFHGALGRGDAPARALQQAQQSLRDRHPHPFHWAAFALYGGW